MNEFVQRLRQRKLVQWSLAYVAFAFALLQGVDIIAQRFAWPAALERYLILALALVFCVVVVLAWYHGDRGAQRIGGAELLIIALLLAIGGVFIWRLGATSTQPHPVLATTPHHAGAPVAGGEPAAAVARAIPAKSIAVLPFENLSNDKDNAYFVAGMQDLILTKLADVGSLKVISRTSTMQYGSHPGNLKTIGEQLGVATILEGSVQKAGNQVLINVQLIDARTDGHVWAQSYTRTLDNIFGVEGEVASQIATTLNAKLSPAQSAQLAIAPTTDQVAYDLFLRAEYQAHRGDVNGDTAGWKRAIALYRQAVEKDHGFALAWARLSTVESRLAFDGGAGEDVAQLNAQARTDAELALKLEPKLPAAQLALGYCAYWGHRDYDDALKAFAVVLAERPNDAEALVAQGFVQRRQGRFDDAIASLTRAAALDPRNFTPTYELANTYMTVSRYVDAQRWLQHALALEPESTDAKTTYARAILFANGDIPRAWTVVQGSAPALTRQRVSLLVYQRKYPQAIALLQGIPDAADNFPGASKTFRLAFVYWMKGDRAHARSLFAQVLPNDRARIDQAHGFAQANLLNRVAVEQFGTGHTAEALAALARSESVLGQIHDSIYIPDSRIGNASVYAMANRADLSVPMLASALAAHGCGCGYSPVLLWLDPVWDPIRHDSGFQALLKKYANSKPAVVYPIPPTSAVAAAPAAP